MDVVTGRSSITSYLKERSVFEAVSGLKNAVFGVKKGDIRRLGESMSLVSSFKGWVGEVQGTLAAKMRLDSQVYRSINNVTIPAANGTTQIDHVIVSKF